MNKIEYYAIVIGAIGNKMMLDHLKILKCKLCTYLQLPHIINKTL